MQKVLGPIRRIRFTQSTPRPASIPEKKLPSLGNREGRGGPAHLSDDVFRHWFWLDGKIPSFEVLRSFQDAKPKVAATVTVRATVRAHGDKLEMAAGDFENLAALLEVARSGKKVPYDQLPGRAMGEDILDRLEAGSVIAEPLAEIVSCKDEEKVRSKGALEPLLSIAEDGTVRRRARRVLCVQPTTFEVPRKKYVILANAWDMARLRGRSRNAVQRYDPSAYRSHANWLLGQDVAEFEAEIGPDVTMPTDVLTCEWNVRKEVARLMNRHHLPIVDAWEAARADKELRWTKFLQPCGVTEKLFAGNAQVSRTPDSSTMASSASSSEFQAMARQVQSLAQSANTLTSKQKRLFSSLGSGAGEQEPSKKGKGRAETI